MKKVLFIIILICIYTQSAISDTENKKKYLGVTMNLSAEDNNINPKSIYYMKFLGSWSMGKSNVDYANKLTEKLVRNEEGRSLPTFPNTDEFPEISISKYLGLTRYVYFNKNKMASVVILHGETTVDKVINMAKILKKKYKLVSNNSSFRGGGALIETYIDNGNIIKIISSNRMYKPILTLRYTSKEEKRYLDKKSLEEENRIKRWKEKKIQELDVL
ncbi:MAG TPA: hypothetical protein EYO75_03570 [Sulfurimonas sp.]|nr:hypothetical protein [Sulfurimonas sp.]HIM74776.1 hypothetical protein [Campylobacterales bacterium]